MKFSNLKKQRGAVLAFCLMMLLLLTLAGTRMIQQNKQQLEMANSARLLTQEFANTETQLDTFKKVINGYYVDDDHKFMEQHIDPTEPTPIPINDSSHQCKPDTTTGTPKQNIGLAGTPLPGVTSSDEAQISSVRCKSYAGTEQVCSILKGSSIICNPNDETLKTDCSKIDSTGAVVVDMAKAVAAFGTTDNDLCYQSYDPQGTTKVISDGKCPKEIYTIQVTSTGTSGAERKIISDHVVGCGG